MSGTGPKISHISYWFTLVKTGPFPLLTIFFFLFPFFFFQGVDFYDEKLNTLYMNWLNDYGEWFHHTVILVYFFTCFAGCRFLWGETEHIVHELACWPRWVPCYHPVPALISTYWYLLVTHQLIAVYVCMYSIHPPVYGNMCIINLWTFLCEYGVTLGNWK